VSRFATDLLKIKAQVVCGFFRPETIIQMACVEQMVQEDQQLVPQAIQMLTTDVLKGFRIEIAADSMIQVDEAEQKKDRLELLEATGGFLEKSMQFVQVAPETAPLIAAIMKFAIASFRAGKDLEGVFDATFDQMTQKAAQPQQSQPNPDMIKAQVAQEEIQSKVQIEAARLQQEQQSSQQRLQMESSRDSQAMQLKAQTDSATLEQTVTLETLRMQHERDMEILKQEFERWKVEFEAGIKMKVAEMTATTQRENALISAEVAQSNSEISAGMQMSKMEHDSDMSERQMEHEKETNESEDKKE
jgi:hypothetical protein